MRMALSINNSIGFDLKGLIVVAGCVILGISVNALRQNGLPLVYLSPQARIDTAVKEMGASTKSVADLTNAVNLEEMEEISSQRSALILDARPEIFYRLGHIPSARSLPRDDFKNHYVILQKLLDEHRDKTVIVYCASDNCRDSQMVANALIALNYRHVSIFKGGWNAWQAAHLPQE